MSTMSYKGYVARISFSALERVLIGKVFGVRDVPRFRGASVDELEAAFHEAIDRYLAHCADLDSSPRRQTVVRVRLTIDPNVQARADRAAKAAGKSLNHWVCDVLAREAERSEARVANSSRAKRQEALRGLRGKFEWVGDLDAMRRDGH